MATQFKIFFNNYAYLLREKPRYDLIVVCRASCWIKTCTAACNKIYMYTIHEVCGFNIYEEKLFYDGTKILELSFNINTNVFYFKAFYFFKKTFFV